MYDINYLIVDHTTSLLFTHRYPDILPVVMISDRTSKAGSTTDDSQEIWFKRRYREPAVA